MAKCRQARRVADCFGCRFGMPWRANTIQDDAGESHAGLHALTAKHNRGRGRTHGGHVEHQEHWTVNRASHSRGAAVL